MLAKVVLLRIGRRLSERRLHFINGLFDYLELGWWLGEHSFTGGRRCTCFEFPEIVGGVIGNAPALYLQFGADDRTMADRWAAALPHAATRLDVFEPRGSATWLPARGRGHAWESQGACRPPLRPADSRIRVHIGSISERLARYEWPTRADAPVIAIFDTDYYPTTKAALEYLSSRLPPQTYLLFDQLNHRADELRAFHEFLMETDARFELFAANRELSCVVFRRTA